MRFLLPVLTLALVIFPAFARADAPVPAGKAPEIRTVRPAQLSPPLSAAQLTKQVQPGMATPAAAAPADGKPMPLSTSLAPDPKLAGAYARAGAAKLEAARGRIAVTPAEVSAAAKPQPVLTALRATPAQAVAQAAVQARKLARGPAVAMPAGRKPASFSTRDAARGALTPAQQAKRDRAAEAGSRSPR